MSTVHDIIDSRPAEEDISPLLARHTKVYAYVTRVSAYVTRVTQRPIWSFTRTL